MIYSGLEFAQYFESDPGGECHNILMAVTPAARMIFTFIQMYFIFLNAKVILDYWIYYYIIARGINFNCVQMAVYCKPRAIAYFGLMHVVATNLCVWLNVIIEETKHEILHQFSHQESNGICVPNVTTISTFKFLHISIKRTLQSQHAIDNSSIFRGEIGIRRLCCRIGCSNRQFLGRRVQEVRNDGQRRSRCQPVPLSVCH